MGVTSGWGIGEKEDVGLPVIRRANSGNLMYSIVIIVNNIFYT